MKKNYWLFVLLLAMICIISAFKPNLAKADDQASEKEVVSIDLTTDENGEAGIHKGGMAIIRAKAFNKNGESAGGDYYQCFLHGVPDGDDSAIYTRPGFNYNLEIIGATSEDTFMWYGGADALYSRSFLVCGVDETASEITVRLSLKEDPSIYDEITFKVLPAEEVTFEIPISLYVHVTDGYDPGILKHQFHILYHMMGPMKHVAETSDPVITYSRPLAESKYSQDGYCYSKVTLTIKALKIQLQGGNPNIPPCNEFAIIQDVIDPRITLNDPDHAFRAFINIFGELKNLGRMNLDWTPAKGENMAFTYHSTFTLAPKTSNLKAVSAGKNRVALSWDAAEGADGYLVYAQKNGKYGYVGMTANTSFTDSKALDTDYNYYWVFPYINDAEGNMRPGKCEKYVFAKGVCKAVTNLKAASLKGGVKLSWSPSAGADGYLVYGIVGGKAYSYVGMTTKGTTFTDKKAATGQYNYYWVYPYHTDASGKMIVGQTAKYTYGKALK